MIQTRQPTIDRALIRVEEEIDIVEAERDAFARFLARLEDASATAFDATGPTTGGGSTALTTGEARQSAELRQIRQAYRETVMALPHYEREYGDTLRESLAEELGETLAGHLVDGQVLAPPVREALVAAVERARNDRGNFRRLLRRERESLETVASELNDIEARLVELDARISTASESKHLATVDSTLAEMEQKCTDLATARQETIHGRTARQVSGIDGCSLVGYLYGGLETATPALSDIASCLDSIRHQRRRCLQ
jgi:ABC-type transporter Mla subunit MlaD